MQYKICITDIHINTCINISKSTLIENEIQNYDILMFTVLCGQKGVCLNTIGIIEAIFNWYSDFSFRYWIKSDEPLCRKRVVISWLYPDYVSWYFIDFGLFDTDLSYDHFTMKEPGVSFVEQAMKGRWRSYLATHICVRSRSLIVSTIGGTKQRWPGRHITSNIFFSLKRTYTFRQRINLKLFVCLKDEK